MIYLKCYLVLKFYNICSLGMALDDIFVFVICDNNYNEMIELLEYRFGRREVKINHE